MSRRSEVIRDYHHPYKPYDVQLQLMNALYDCIEQGKVGIFESPTGTGKSLSLICGALTWLREHQREIFEQSSSNGQDEDDDPPWMVEHARMEKRQASLYRRQEQNERLARIRAKDKALRERHANGESRTKRLKTQYADSSDNLDDESQYLLDDYASDTESSGKPTSNNANDDGTSEATRALMTKLGLTLEPKVGNADDEVDELKVFFCSRTHSQLGQFIGELGRVRIPALVETNPHPESERGPPAAPSVDEDFKHLTLGSRKNLCINPKVNKLSSATAITERCLDLQQLGTSSSGKCGFLPSKETQVQVNDFRDHTMAKLRDIEDLAVLGKRLGICPYYASRSAVKPSEIITLPYPLLLQKSAREALGLSIKDHVVIIDEAHNIMDAIINIFSVSISLSQLRRAHSQLATYWGKFKSRLKGKNYVYVAQTTRLILSLTRYLEKALKSKDVEGAVQQSELMAGEGVDQVNMYKLCRYLKESKLGRKVDGYAVLCDSKPQATANASSVASERRPSKGTTPTLTHIQNFLIALMNPSEEGRFFYSRSDNGDISLKYMLLDPSHHFREVVEEARAVILAGGTMSPMDDYRSYLFPYLPPERLMTLSCGHVIDPSNLLAVPVITGPDSFLYRSEDAFRFTFSNRDSSDKIMTLGRAILRFIQIIPDGAVCFFPSYAFLDSCVAIWRAQRVPTSLSGGTSSDGRQSFWNLLQQTKPIFSEARTTTRPTDSTRSHADPDLSSSSLVTSAADSTFTAYSYAVRNPPPSQPHHGALLLAVVGGSLSEGINFSDALGRGVMVVGLPYPNPHSAEWSAKLNYIAAKADARAAEEANVVRSGAPVGVKKGKEAAREHLESVCMRAVNQCIGRAIRHKDDYAVILLLDERYKQRNIREKLPRWIRASMATEGKGWYGARDDIREFFRRKHAEGKS